MSKAEESITPERTGGAEELRTQLEHEESRFKGAAARVVQNSKAAAQRWGRQGLHAAEGLAGNTRDRIKNDPVRSAAISFVLGLSVGALIAWSSSRHLTRSQ